MRTTPLVIKHARVVDVNERGFKVEWQTESTGECQIRLFRGPIEQEKRTVLAVPTVTTSVVTFEGLERQHRYTVVIENNDDRRELSVTTA